MQAVFKNEIRHFFAHLTGYLIIGLFLLMSGLFLWVLKGPFNILENGFADLGGFYQLSPFIFLFLIPAITMRSFAEEKRSGTFETLMIKPVTTWEVVIGKFLGCACLLVLALIPTLTYIWTLDSLVVDNISLDLGVLLSVYLGLFLLGLAYIAIGLFLSAVAQNQVVAFLLTLICCWLVFTGLDSIASLFSKSMYTIISSLGMNSHLETMAFGVISLSDIVYFASLIGLFLYLTYVRLKTDRP
ncbi:MAG: ABC transporter permease subunit [Bacteroidia bacterium]|nr:ABC transporter permease subunit [Bacteroidia bacterium]